jgi:hypothetical protein
MKPSFWQRFRRWLSGEFTCRKCGKTWYSYASFGFGEMICPDCYRGEQPWLFPDMNCWLNRLLYTRGVGGGMNE